MRSFTDAHPPWSVDLKGQSCINLRILRHLSQSDSHHYTMLICGSHLFNTAQAGFTVPHLLLSLSIVACKPLLGGLSLRTPEVVVQVIEAHPAMVTNHSSVS